MSRAKLLLCLFVAGCGTYSPLDSHYNRGVEYYDDGRAAEAIREYKLAIEDDPGNYRAHYNLAVVYHDQGKKDLAAQEYLEVIRLDPNNARARVSLASLRADEGKDEEALKLLEEAAAADRDSSFPKESLGAYYERKGELDAALKAYHDALDLEPTSAAGHAGLARIYTHRGAFQDAVTEYDKALETHGSDVATLIAASEAHEKVGDLIPATELLERALVNLKDRPAPWIRLAHLYECQNRLEDAVAALWEARAIDPANPEVGPRLKPLYQKLYSKEK